jgi:hypothetical protein
MRPCPECGSTEVYYGKVRERKGGLRDEHQTFIPTSGSDLYADTYICINCGYVRLFLDEKSKKDAVSIIPKDWKKVG